MAPFGGMSKDLSALVGTKLESGKGAYVPLMEPSSGNQVIIAFLSGADAAEVDARNSGPMKVSGELKTIDDAALAKTLEGKLGGSLFQQDGKPVYLLLDGDPWPTGAATPAPKGTP